MTATHAEDIPDGTYAQMDTHYIRTDGYTNKFPVHVSKHAEHSHLSRRIHEIHTDIRSVIHIRINTLIKLGWQTIYIQTHRAIYFVH